MSHRCNRTRLWVDPPFQIRLLLRMTVYLGAYALFVFHIGFIFYCMLAIGRAGVDRPLVTLYGEYLEQQMGLLYGFAVIVPILLYDLLKFSHRIAGPLFRCRTVMEEMASGKTAREFVPRRGDLLAELFAAFNKLIQAWNARVLLEENPPGPGAAREADADECGISAAPPVAHP